MPRLPQGTGDEHAARRHLFRFCPALSWAAEPRFRFESAREARQSPIQRPRPGGRSPVAGLLSKPREAPGRRRGDRPEDGVASAGRTRAFP